MAELGPDGLRREADALERANPDVGFLGPKEDSGPNRLRRYADAWERERETCAAEHPPEPQYLEWCRLGQPSTADLRAVLEHERTRLRQAICECAPRAPDDEVPIDNLPGHHDFSCPYRTGAPGGLLDAAALERLEGKEAR